MFALLFLDNYEGKQLPLVKASYLVKEDKNHTINEFLTRLRSLLVSPVFKDKQKQHFNQNTETK